MTAALLALLPWAIGVALAMVFLWRLILAYETMQWWAVAVVYVLQTAFLVVALFAVAAWFREGWRLLCR